MEEERAIPQEDRAEEIEPGAEEIEPAGEAAEAAEVAEVRHLPVLASEARPLEPARTRVLAAPAAAAAGGFLAGLITFVMVRALRARPRRGGGRLLRRRKSGAERALEIAASRSFLVDVHVVKR